MNIELEQVIAIGDGANDLGPPPAPHTHAYATRTEAAPYPVAYRTAPKVEDPRRY
jgi:hypothetical protein